jgi:uncharacterized coiled-coil protein SlyX
MCSKEEFLQKRGQIKTQTSEITRKIELTRLTVNEECLELARSVDIAAETRIEQLSESATEQKQQAIDKINDRRRLLLAEIKDYEAECVASVEATKGALLTSVKSAEKWVELMESTSLPRYENFKVVLNDQADTRVTQLKHLFLQLRAFQFGGKQMTFVECSLGSLQIERLRVPKVIESHFKSSGTLQYSL